MVAKAFAKINISLRVNDKREDGYHNIETIMIPLELHDSIEIHKDKHAFDDYVTCDDFALKTSKYNSCHEVISEARDVWGFKERVNVAIHKNIFLQAGLGGGSADAAATLLTLVKLFKIDAKEDELLKIAIKIGSDVPRSLYNKPSIVRQKGEIVECFEMKKQLYCLLIKPNEGLLTKTIFEKYDAFNDNLVKSNKASIEEIKNVLVKGDLTKLSEIAYNDLEDCAISFVPEIKTIKEDLYQKGMEFVLMSGSGSTVFALTTNLKKAKQIEKEYIKKGYQTELTKTLNF